MLVKSAKIAPALTAVKAHSFGGRRLAPWALLISVGRRHSQADAKELFRATLAEPLGQRTRLPSLTSLLASNTALKPVTPADPRALR